MFWYYNFSLGSNIVTHIDYADYVSTYVMLEWYCEEDKGKSLYIIYSCFYLCLGPWLLCCVYRHTCIYDYNSQLCHDFYLCPLYYDFLISVIGLSSYFLSYLTLIDILTDFLILRMW